MKNLTTFILSSFLIIQVSGQEIPDSTIVHYTIQLPLTDTIKWVENYPKRIDTALVLMLVSDTSSSTVRNGMGGYSENKNRFGYWDYGYLVSEKTWECCNPSDHMNASYYWVTNKSYYLDAEKKPLSPSIIVWMAK